MNKFYINFISNCNLLIINTLELKQITKDFIKHVKSLRDSGEVANNQEIIDAIGWNKSTMSTVMKGQGDIPAYKYKKFVEVYGLNDKVQQEVKQDPEKDKIISDQAATIKKLQDDVSKLINLLQEANSLTLKKGYASSILQPYLEQLAAGLAGKQLKGVNDVLEEFDTILGGSLGAGEKSGKYG